MEQPIHDQSVGLGEPTIRYVSAMTYQLERHSDSHLHRECRANYSKLILARDMVSHYCLPDRTVEAQVRSSLRGCRRTS